MKISEQLENREVPLCVICKENPAREGLKTCSKECSKAYKKAYKKAYWKTYQKTDKYKAYKKAYYQKKKLKNKEGK